MSRLNISFSEESKRCKRYLTCVKEDLSFVDRDVLYAKRELLFRIPANIAFALSAATARLGNVEAAEKRKRKRHVTSVNKTNIKRDLQTLAQAEVRKYDSVCCISYTCDV
jgi:hypothetical protein